MTDFIWSSLIAGAIGFVFAFIYIKRNPSDFEENLYQSVYAGKRVVLAVEDDVYIFSLEAGRMMIRQAKGTFVEKLDNNV